MTRPKAITARPARIPILRACAASAVSSAMRYIFTPGILPSIANSPPPTMAPMIPKMIDTMITAGIARERPFDHDRDHAPERNVDIGDRDAMRRGRRLNGHGLPPGCARRMVGQTARLSQLAFREGAHAHRRSQHRAARGMAQGRAHAHARFGEERRRRSSACSSNGASRATARRPICMRSRRCCMCSRARPTCGSSETHATLDRRAADDRAGRREARLFQQRHRRRCTSSRRSPRRCSRRPTTTSARRRGAGCRS